MNVSKHGYFTFYGTNHVLKSEYKILLSFFSCFDTAVHRSGQPWTPSGSCQSGYGPAGPPETYRFSTSGPTPQYNHSIGPCISPTTRSEHAVSSLPPDRFQVRINTLQQNKCRWQTTKPTKWCVGCILCRQFAVWRNLLRQKMTEMETNAAIWCNSKNYMCFLRTCVALVISVCGW